MSRRTEGPTAGRPETSTDRPLLLVEDLSLTRDGRRILSGVELEVAPGEVHCLLGPNGSGKSSLAYAIVGCPDYVPDGGSIRFAGHDLSPMSMAQRARLGLTLAWQEPARFEGLTVRDYVGLGSAGEDLERIIDCLGSVALAPHVYLSRPVDRTLSGGERKRIELAAVFAMRPTLAILDEPDSGIDVLSLDEVAGVVRRMAQAGSAVLLITHRDEMVAVADSASLMCQGSVVLTGEPEEVRAYFVGRCRLHEQISGLHAGLGVPEHLGDGEEGR
ncbi:MAG TPA: ABC transporter ATP-binding protein [Actinomycetota bacterium]